MSIDVIDEVAFKLALKVDGVQRHVISENNMSPQNEAATTTSKTIDVSLRTGQRLDILVIESSQAFHNSGRYSNSQDSLTSSMIKVYSLQNNAQHSNNCMIVAY